MAQKKTPVTSPPPEEKAKVADFAQAVALFERREPLLHAQLKQDAQLVKFAPGSIEIHLPTPMTKDFAIKVADCLTRWTGEKWTVALSGERGDPTLREQEIARKQKAIDEVRAHPLVATVLEQFPGAKVLGVKEDA